MQTRCGIKSPFGFARMVPKGVRQRSHPARMQLTQFARFSVNFEKPQYAQTAVSSPRPSREWSAPFLKVPLGGAFGIGSQLLAYHFIRYLEESLLRSRRDCRSGGGMMTAPLSPDGFTGGLHDGGQVETARD